VLSVLFDECGIWLLMSFVSTNFSYTSYWGRHGCDHMVVGFTTTYFVCLYTCGFLLSLCKIAQSSVILLLPLLNYALRTHLKWPRCLHVHHRPVASHWQTLSHNIVLSTSCHELCSNSQLKFNKGNNKTTELRAILQRESKNPQVYKQTKSVNNRKTVKTVMTLTWYRHF
jgi:hypothetical protein